LPDVAALVKVGEGKGYGDDSLGAGCWVPVFGSGEDGECGGGGKQGVAGNSAIACWQVIPSVQIEEGILKVCFSPQQFEGGFEFGFEVGTEAGEVGGE